MFNKQCLELKEKLNSINGEITKIDDRNRLKETKPHEKITYMEEDNIEELQKEREDILKQMKKFGCEI
ncbi:MAG: hypothetical protein A3A97_03310 [Candidatus Terrybacteria bacterium RIFCSPLOWO2_01_FULL_40_23]|uniref:Valyl-tRNA synthetase tRNA-binding arm domain-containing protein n=1 Tax=Candidatus Terrybacteria bacterium RIFCSPLOWO2_01_FULL_40_23 TaxID=1802366 RepID=A0A1G2PQF3_9BACT|nr:MAG: hypothetical protein A3A97_03310 [Candidatus Terrybacteria bacterium RIFCSPLOWO2_01_FULL_40_23]